VTRHTLSDPGHVAIIMDGNGRWAEARGRARTDGHREGADRVRDVVTRCRRLGLRHLTLYAFSSENWGRPALEVDALMALLGRFLRRELDTLRRHAVELRAIGDLRRLPRPLRGLLLDAVATTRGLGGMRLTLALSYGGRDEIARAVRRLASEVEDGSLVADAIDEGAVARRLDTADTPDPDLVIRTGGERRLSNFLLWQAAYAELYFTDTPWPEFGATELDRALTWFRVRRRRFGLVAEVASRHAPDCTASASVSPPIRGRSHT
jgi:undecaprenyl diphosphate synthase